MCRRVTAWLSDPCLSPVMVRAKIVEYFGVAVPVTELLAFWKAEQGGCELWLRAKDIASREQRSVNWAKKKMRDGAFGPVKRIGERITEVRESGYLAWLTSRMQPAAPRRAA
jgi:hypothetical protein